MKKLFFILPLLLASVGAFSQGFDSEEVRAELTRKYGKAVFHDNNDIQWFSVTRKGKAGICDLNGKVLVSPGKYTSVTPSKDGEILYLTIKNQDNIGLADISGKEIVAPGPYSSIKLLKEQDFAYVIVKKGGYEGVFDMTGKAIIAPDKYSDVKLKNKFGVWYYFEVKSGSKYGVVNLDGKVAVPAEYSSVRADNRGIGFDVCKSSEGVHSYSPYAEFIGSEYALYANGRHDYFLEKSHFAIPDDYSFSRYSRKSKDSGIVVVPRSSKSSSTSSRSSSSSASGSGNKSNEPIFKCDYMIHYENSQWPAPVTVEFYKGHITIFNIDYHFDHVEGIYSIYSGVDSYGNRMMYYVDFDYNMKQVQELWSPYGVGYQTSRMTKDGEPAPLYTPNANSSVGSSMPSSSSTSSSSSSSSSSERWHTVTKTEECPHCHGTGVCQTCNGKGWYYSPFGTGTLACPNCWQDHNGKCSFCRGTGQVKKMTTEKY